MSNNFLVYNVETNQRLRYKQAVKLEAQGQILWVDPGKTWRNATTADLPHILANRAKEAATAERIASAEIPGIKFESPASAKAYEAEHRGLIQAANQIANPPQTPPNG